MKSMVICDTTLKEQRDKSLSFRKKLDIASLLGSMKIPVIELGTVTRSTEDRLLIKSVASAIQDSTLSVCIGFDETLIAPCMEGLKTAKHQRLQVRASLSTARMEYVYHKKQNEMIPLIEKAISECKAAVSDVEFVADDATRADEEFLKAAISAAISAGATTITICDNASTLLPSEFAEFLTKIQENVPELQKVSLGVECGNGLDMANALAVAALKCGATEVKASACATDGVSLSTLVKILSAKRDVLPSEITIPTENIEHQISVIKNLTSLSLDGKTPFEDGVRVLPDNVFFTAKDSEHAISKEIKNLGYTLSDEDKDKVYRAFQRIVSRKERIALHELEVIVASEAMQVPQTYKLESFVTTTGNKVDTVAHIKLSKGTELLDGISLGNGSVDASFLAIEKILGCHYELDDFQIMAITEGKEAMGQTLVKLRSKGKVYSGKGVSTDIVSSAIEAYLNSLNKIVYEEERSAMNGE